MIHSLIPANALEDLATARFDVVAWDQDLTHLCDHVQFQKDGQIVGEFSIRWTDPRYRDFRVALDRFFSGSAA